MGTVKNSIYIIINVKIILIPEYFFEIVITFIRAVNRFHNRDNKRKERRKHHPHKEHRPYTSIPPSSLCFIVQSAEHNTVIESIPVGLVEM